MKSILILAIIILIFNILSLDFDGLLDFENNKKPYVNIIISILIILMVYYKKSKT